MSGYASDIVCLVSLYFVSPGFILSGLYATKKFFLCLSFEFFSNIGTKKSCGIISYIKFALDSGPIWVSDKILRIYYENQFGSITNEWTSEKKAQETVLCYQNL